VKAKRLLAAKEQHREETATLQARVRGRARAPFEQPRDAV